MDHTDQFQILTRFLNHFASTRQTVERSGEGRPWSCSVADPSRGQQCLCPQDMTQAPRPTQTTSNPQGQYTLVRRTKNKNTRKQKVTRHVCPKLKVKKSCVLGQWLLCKDRKERKKINWSSWASDTSRGMDGTSSFFQYLFWFWWRCNQRPLWCHCNKRKSWLWGREVNV